MDNYAQQTEPEGSNSHKQHYEVKKIFIIALCCFLVFICMNCFLHNARDNVQITIKNQTENMLDNLYLMISYANDTKELPVRLEAGKTEKLSFELPNDFTEGNISLYYYDYNNILHEEVIVGYVEQRNGVDAEVSVRFMDQNGILDIMTTKSRVTYCLFNPLLWL